MLLIERCPEAGLFRELSNYIFRSLYFRKYINYEGHLLFPSVQNLIKVSKTQKTIDKKVFISYITASDLVTLNYPS